MVLSIIVVNYNSSGSILSCLQSIRNWLERMSYELIVVDNHSTDNSCQLVQEKFRDLCLVQNSENRGFARAVNQGFGRTRGKYLLILNPDVTITPGSIDRAIDFLNCHPEVGLLLPKLVNPDGTLQFSCRTFYNFPTLLFRRTPLGKIFPNHQIIRKHLMMDWNHEEIREVDWGLGACIFLRREALKGQNLFDERFFLYFEDVDLCFRLKKEGWKVLYYPEAVMVHAHARMSAEGFFNRAKWEHFKSLIKFCFKHGRLKPRVSKR